MSLGIEDITIGYSAKGVVNYANELADGITQKVNAEITSGAADLEQQFRGGWQGAACDKYIEKLEASTDKLKEILKDMADSFKAAVSTQKDQYAQEDNDMTEVIEGQQVL